MFNSRYYVSEEQWQPSNFPWYMNGGGYVLSRDLVSILVHTAQPYLQQTQNKQVQALFPVFLHRVGLMKY